MERIRIALTEKRVMGGTMVDLTCVLSLRGFSIFLIVCKKVHFVDEKWFHDRVTLGAFNRSGVQGL